jgi:pyrimidine operon attenuation protein / uracil phosphoribosyltransferase
LKLPTPLATLDVSFYRDDYEARGLHRDLKGSEMPFEVDGRDLVLVDDVLYTGRTIRAALNEVFDYGRPSSVLLAVLVDRGGRQLPMAAQFCGAALTLEAGRNIGLKRDAQGHLSFELREAKR